jgi:hypothetical protein
MKAMAMFRNLRDLFRSLRFNGELANTSSAKDIFLHSYDSFTVRPKAALLTNQDVFETKSRSCASHNEHRYIRNTFSARP